MASRSQLPLGDRLPVGGPSGSEALLAFGALPARSAILGALLVLQPLDPSVRVERSGEFLVEHVEPFRGGALPSRSRVGPRAFLAASRSVPEGPARPIRVDVTRAARDAAERADRTLHLLLRLEGGDAAGLSLTSPWAFDPDVQPRLELLLH